MTLLAEAVEAVFLSEAAFLTTVFGLATLAVLALGAALALGFFAAFSGVLGAAAFLALRAFGFGA